MGTYAACALCAEADMNDQPDCVNHAGTTGKHRADAEHAHLFDGPTGF